MKHGDIVIASKRHINSQVEVPLSRRILSESFNGLVRLLTGVPLKDTQSGLKAMKKSAFINIFPRLAVKRYAFDVELLAVANLYGLKVVEMPVNIKLDAKFKPSEMWHMFMDLLGIAYRLRIIHWYQTTNSRKKWFSKHGFICSTGTIMSSKPLVSIIIPCKEVDDYTIECIELL